MIVFANCTEERVRRGLADKDGLRDMFIYRSPKYWRVKLNLKDNSLKLEATPMLFPPETPRARVMSARDLAVKLILAGRVKDYDAWLDLKCGMEREVRRKNMEGAAHQ